jgi:glycine/D-amino acid oxidase-like deaminating enzyme
MADVLELSPWVADPTDPQPELVGDARADVAIIGGGYLGLATALALRGRGADVVLLEQQFCGFGASGRNAGHLTPTIGKDAATLLRFFGVERAGQLMRFAERAVQHTERLIERLAIDCDYRPVGNIVAGVHARQERTLRRAAAAATRLGVDAAFLGRDDMRGRGIPPAFPFGVLEPRGGHLHPGKYVRGLRAAALRAGVRIHERTAVQRIDPTPVRRVLAARGAVHAAHVVLATNAFTPATLGALRRRIVPMRVNLFRTAPLDDAQLARLGWSGGEGIYTAHEMLESYRLAADRRVVGGSKLVQYAFGGALPPANQPRAFAALEAAFRTRFPMLDDVPIEAFWGGWIAMTLDFLPLCGATGGDRSLVHGVGFNGHGLAQATAMGEMIADLIADRPNGDVELLRRRLLPLPPEPFLWLVVHGITAVLEAIDRRVDRAALRSVAGDPV